MYRFIALLCLLIAIPATAETRLYVGGWSYHLSARDMISNENHRVLAIEHRNVIAGYFRNSFDVDSYLIGYRMRYRLARDWEASLIAGVSHGYSNCLKHDDNGTKQACPLLIPALTYTQWRLEPSLLLMGPALTATAAYRF